MPQMDAAEITLPGGFVDVRLRKTDRIEVSQVIDACARMLGGTDA
jgi:hypothetical protein